MAVCFSSSRKSKAPENYRVLLGSTQLYQHTPQTREVSVSRIITHPDFEKLHPFGSDIAMLQLRFPVNFTSYIIPACLPVPGMKLPSNSSCWITGWGMLNEESERVWGVAGGMRIGRRRKGRRTEEQRREVCPHLRRPQAKVPLAHYASFPEDWTILVLVLKVCDSKALEFPKV